MGWYVELQYEDGTTERMYCVSRQEARERRRFYLQSARGDGYKIGKPLAGAVVRKAGGDSDD